MPNEVDQMDQQWYQDQQESPSQGRVGELHFRLPLSHVSHSGAQVSGQCGIDRSTCANKLIIDPSRSARMTDPIEEFLEGLKVPIAQGPWIACQCVDRLHTFKPSGIIEWKVQFIIIHDMEDQNIMPAAAKSGESFECFSFTS